MSQTKTAIVTGACSGIGLAVTQHLLTKSDARWHVILVDFRPEAYEAIKSSLDSQRTEFVNADVSKWEDNARFFKVAYYGQEDNANKSSGPKPRKIDFFFANAGTADKEQVAQVFDLDAEPAKPNLSCFDVLLIGVLYGLKLFIHYTRKAKRDLAADLSGSSFEPKMVITSSMTGQYPFPVAPQYAAGKAAVLSITRSVGPSLLKSDGIAVNCLMPDYVATNITPPGLNDAWPKQWITPTETIARAVDELISTDGTVAQDGKSNGANGVVKAGQSVECAVEELFYRKPVEYVNEGARFLIEESFTPEGLWQKYIDRAIREQGGIGISR